MRSISSRSADFTFPRSESSRRLSRSRTLSSNAVAVWTPTSAEKRISSSSESAASSSSLLAPMNAFKRAMKPPRVFARPSARVRPASRSASLRRASSPALRPRQALGGRRYLRTADPRRFDRLPLLRLRELLGGARPARHKSARKERHDQCRENQDRDGGGDLAGFQGEQHGLRRSLRKWEK